MKKLIIINGTMGVGKTTTCNKLLNMITPSVFLDGDWCWNINPFIVTDETKLMVIDNITHLLKNFLCCSEYEYVIFCWVLHKESIMKDILNNLKDFKFELFVITLMCSEKALRDRLTLDINNNVRKYDVIERSLQKSDFYIEMDTTKIDVSDIDAHQAAIEIVKIIGEEYKEL